MFDEAMAAWGSAHNWSRDELFQFHLCFKASYGYFWSKGRIIHPLPYRETMSRKAMSTALLRILEELFTLHKNVPSLPAGPCVGHTLSGRCLSVDLVFCGRGYERVVQCTTCSTLFRRGDGQDFEADLEAPWFIISDQDFAVLQIMRS